MAFATCSFLEIKIGKKHASSGHLDYLEEPKCIGRSKPQAGSLIYSGTNHKDLGHAENCISEIQMNFKTIREFQMQKRLEATGPK